jgi:hypothetical protein
MAPEPEEGRKEGHGLIKTTTELFRAALKKVI